MICKYCGKPIVPFGCIYCGTKENGKALIEPSGYFSNYVSKVIEPVTQKYTYFKGLRISRLSSMFEAVFLVMLELVILYKKSLVFLVPCILAFVLSLGLSIFGMVISIQEKRKNNNPEIENGIVASGVFVVCIVLLAILFIGYDFLENMPAILQSFYETSLFVIGKMEVSIEFLFLIFVIIIYVISLVRVDTCFKKNKKLLKNQKKFNHKKEQ